MKSPLLVSLLLVHSYLDAAAEKKQAAASKKQKLANKRVLSKAVVSKEPITLCETNLKDMLSGKLTIVMVGAEWCRWCRLMQPVFTEGYQSTKENASYALLDLGNHFRDKASLLKQLQLDYKIADIESIPSFLVFKEGKFAEAIKGSQTKEQLAALVKKHLAGDMKNNTEKLAQPQTA